MITLEMLYSWEMMRKRRIGGYSPATGYRTADLILHLDAIQNTRLNGHVSEATVWENLANNFDVTMYNATWGRDHCSFTGAVDSYGIGDYWTFTKGTTIEVVFSCIENGTTAQQIAGWLNDNDSGRFGAYVRATRKACSLSFGGTVIENSNVIPDGAIQHIGFSYGFSVFNGVSESEVPVWYIGNASITKFRIGQWISSGNPIYPLMGSVYAVRVYDANLTAEELYAHWLIDKARFNIPD